MGDFPANFSVDLSHSSFSARKQCKAGLLSVFGGRFTMSPWPWWELVGITNENVVKFGKGR